jgi:hypothetical protein
MTNNLAQILPETSVIRVYVMHVQISQKCNSHLKILAVTRMTWSQFHTEYPQILGATVQIWMVHMTWRQAFVHTWSKGLCYTNLLGVTVTR